LTDTAVLSGGASPTGTIVFTLNGPNGFSFSQTDPVTDNGSYSASTSASAVGTYTWTADYSGDTNNSPAADQGGPAEQTVIQLASPTLATTASPATAVPSPTATLTDTAVLSGGASPTGTIVFTLAGPGGFSFTQTDTVTGNGSYTASTPGVSAVGTYTWKAQYSGDASNNPANDQGGTSERTVLQSATPAPVSSQAPPGQTGPSGQTVSQHTSRTASQAVSGTLPTGGVATGGGKSAASDRLLFGTILAGLGLLTLASGAVALRRRRG